LPGLQSDGSTIPATDFVTTVTVRLQSFVITLQVELTEDKAKADPRVRFTAPGRAQESQFVAASIAKAKAELDAQYAARVEAAAYEHHRRLLLQPNECRTNRARVRSENLVLELRQLCRYGHRIYVRFFIENRGRALFVPGEPTLALGDGKGNFTPVDTGSLLSVQELTFTQVAEGIADADLDDPNVRALSLTILERGGPNRSIELKDFTF
jgi:hypothetical protein